MKNKIVLSVVIVLLVVAVAAISVYFFKQNRPADNTAPENPSNVPANETAENQENEINPDQSQNKLVTDDFEIVLPAGWEKTTPPVGISAMAVNVNEQLNEPAAQKINFKSYVAVSYDTLQGKTINEYLQTVKNELSQTVANVVFTNERDISINDRPARAIEAEFAQQGVNFKILMVVISGKGEDVWVISFNTTQNGWDGYKEVFSNIAKSFTLKK